MPQFDPTKPMTPNELMLWNRVQKLESALRLVVTMLAEAGVAEDHYAIQLAEDALRDGQ